MANDYAPDYPTVRAPPKAIPSDVALKGIGARMMYSSLGRIFSTFEQGAAKAEHMRAYNEMGVEAAQNIRTRFYQEEWKQVQQARLKPLIDQLNELRASYEQASTIAVRPVPRGITPEEGEGIAQSMARPGVPIKSADGKTAAGPPDVPPNVAVMPGQLGGVEMIDAPSVINPQTEQPIDINTPEGRSVLDKAVDDFWGGYANINTQMMDIIAEYQGNPFADAAAGSMIENVMRQAGQGVSGKTDPRDQEAHWAQVQQQAAELEATQVGTTQGRMAISQADAKREALEQAARTDVLDPRKRGLYGDTLANKLLSEKPLTPNQSAKAAAIYRLDREREMADLRISKEAGVARIPTTILDNTGSWQSWMLDTDTTFNQYADENLSTYVNRFAAKIANDPQAYIDTNPRVTEPMKARILAGNLSDPQVQVHIKSQAATPKVLRQVRADAFARRLYDYAVADPAGDVERRIKGYADAARQRGLERGKWDEGLERWTQTDPVGFFATMLSGTDIMYKPQAVYVREEAYDEAHRPVTRPLSYTPVQQAPGVVEEEEPSTTSTYYIEDEEDLDRMTSKMAGKDLLGLFGIKEDTAKVTLRQRRERYNRALSEQRELLRARQTKRLKTIGEAE